MATQDRVDRDIANDRPIVIHTLVALADNKNQWIVPVPEFLGDGQNPKSNLYWGAMYGVKNFLINKSGWKLISNIESRDSRILERIVLKKEFLRKGKNLSVYLVADAWDGKHIDETVDKFLSYNAGNDPLKINVDDLELLAGGGAHLMVYIGHNYLMDFAGLRSKTFGQTKVANNNPDNDAFVLACKSKPYFKSILENVSANPLILTSGLMAPEAYTLNAAIEKWISGSDTNEIRKAAAESYSQYQKTGKRAAEWLFGVK